jgi:hypothetical protein
MLDHTNWEKGRLDASTQKHNIPQGDKELCTMPKEKDQGEPKMSL